MFKIIRWAFRQGRRITAKEIIADLTEQTPAPMLYPRQSDLKELKDADNDSRIISRDYQKELINYQVNVQVRAFLISIKNQIGRKYVEEEDLE